MMRMRTSAITGVSLATPHLPFRCLTCLGFGKVLGVKSGSTGTLAFEKRSKQHRMGHRKGHGVGAPDVLSRGRACAGHGTPHEPLECVDTQPRRGARSGPADWTLAGHQIGRAHV